MKIALGLLIALVTSLVQAAAPQPGLWWNPSESGRGYGIDSQGGILVLTVFAYGHDGRMQWYYADGPLTNDGTRWSGTLLKFDFGQPLSGGYRSPNNVGSEGAVSLAFSSRTTGTITFGGRSVPIERQNFGVGGPPDALLGQWAMAYSIGTSDYLDRYNLTTIGGATSSGNGAVADTAKRAAFEYQVSGAFAGRVVGFRFSSSGTALDQYLFTLQLEEGRGFWVSPTTFNEYGMNVYKTHTRNGMSKSLDASVAVDQAAKGIRYSEAKGRSLDEIEANDPALGAIAKGLWEKLRAMQ
jgi:hypothetical protein